MALGQSGSGRVRFFNCLFVLPAESYLKLFGILTNKAGMSETWKQIEGFNNYEVSDHGRIRNKKTNKMLKPYDSCGRMNVKLYVNGKGFGKRLHILVATAFLPNPDQKEHVYHSNLDVRNCRADNLYWISEAECDELARHHARRKAMLQE